MKILKWIGIIMGVIVLIIVTFAVTLNVTATNRINKTHETAVKAIDIPKDEASIENGKHFVQALCTSCHGGALEGKIMIDDGSIASVYAPNLTSGKGGIGSEYTDLDWVRSIRHGIRPNNQALFIMPSHEFINISKEDLGSIIAYLKSMPPANKEWPQNTYKPLGKIMIQLGLFGKEIIPAEVIDHSKEYVSAPLAGPTHEYGQYLVNFSGCRSCHGVDLKGSQPNEPGAPLAPDLTAAGNIGKWTSEQFIATLRSGVTPEGKELNSVFMPYYGFAKYSDEYLTAIHTYLSSLEPAVAEK